MEKKIVKKVMKVQDMTCSSCELKIEKELMELKGVEKAKADYSMSKVYITYDSEIVALAEIIQAVSKAGYHAEEYGKEKKGKLAKGAVNKQNQESINQLLGMGIIVLALFVIIKNTIGFNFIPEISQSMGYGILFVVGLLTSFHCIAMCGGINLSQCISYKHLDNTKMGNLAPSMLYNAGRVVSYTAIGGAAGGIGSVVSFSGAAKGLVAIGAGIFMVIMGINMLNIFPWLKKLNFRMPKIFGKKIYNGNSKRGPFYIGLLNGLMPCGPLQSMQLYALGTGSIAAGALSMFMFSLGTVPLMFGFGAVSTMFGKRFTGRLMKVSAALVIVLGVIMTGRGLSLSGISTASADISLSGNVAGVQNGVQTVSIDLQPRNYEPIIVQKGIPVRFIINAEENSINGCNNSVIIPRYNIEKALEPGENLIEFMPEEAGNIPYSCWMGMIRSNIKVVDDINNIDIELIKKDIESFMPAGGGGCCGL